MALGDFGVFTQHIEEVVGKSLRCGHPEDITVKAGAGGEQRPVIELVGCLRERKVGLYSSPAVNGSEWHVKMGPLGIWKSPPKPITVGEYLYYCILLYTTLSPV